MTALLLTPRPHPHTQQCQQPTPPHTNWCSPSPFHTTFTQHSAVFQSRLRPVHTGTTPPYKTGTPLPTHASPTEKNAPNPQTGLPIPSTPPLPTAEPSPTRPSISHTVGLHPGTTQDRWNCYPHKLPSRKWTQSSCIAFSLSGVARGGTPLTVPVVMGSVLGAGAEDNVHTTCQRVSCKWMQYSCCASLHLTQGLNTTQYIC